MKEKDMIEYYKRMMMMHMIQQARINTHNNQMQALTQASLQHINQLRENK